jgi:DNA-binding NtrC family response regulator
LDEMLGMEHSGNRLHVLVIEEDDATRSACMEIATQRGFSAEGLAEAPNAQQLLHNHTVDLLLMELKSTRRDGMQLLEEVKALKPDTAIIVMTSTTTIGTAVEAMRSGATDYLTKPFLMEELGTVLERAAHQRQAGGASRELRERLRSTAALEIWSDGARRWTSSTAFWPRLRRATIRR